MTTLPDYYQATETTPPGDSPPISLLPQDARLIEASAICTAVRDERGYRSVIPPGAKTAGFADWQARSGLLIPIHSVTGEQTLYQLRPHHPRMSKAKDGKPAKAIKYETVSGAAMQIDCPPCFRASLANPKIPLLLTEGVRKIDAFASAVRREKLKLCGVAFLGVWNWKNRANTYKESVPLPDWQHIPLKGRTVYICFDSDSERIENVGLALTHLQAFLEAQGAKVRFLPLPDDVTSDGQPVKVGLDDWLAHEGNTVTDLLTLAKDHSDEPTSALFRTRQSALKRSLSGIADPLPHGGLKFGQEVTAEEAMQAIASLKGFYGRIEDAMKFDFIDAWYAFAKGAGERIHRQEGIYQEKLFGKWGKQLKNWIYRIGSDFARNTDNRRRPECPFWLHELLHKAEPPLSIEQEIAVFDTYQAEMETGHFLTSEDVSALIKEQFGVSVVLHADRKGRKETGKGAEIPDEEASWMADILKDDRWEIVEKCCDSETVKKQINALFEQLLRVNEDEKVNQKKHSCVFSDSPDAPQNDENTSDININFLNHKEKNSNENDQRSGLQQNRKYIVEMPEHDCVCNGNTFSCVTCDKPEIAPGVLGEKDAMQAEALLLPYRALIEAAKRGEMPLRINSEILSIAEPLFLGEVIVTDERVPGWLDTLRILQETYYRPLSQQETAIVSSLAGGRH